MSKRFKSRSEAIHVRMKACELAAIVTAELGEDDTARLWARCVFFETYITLGAAVTNKRMDLVPDETAQVLKLVK